MTYWTLATFTTFKGHERKHLLRIGGRIALWINEKKKTVEYLIFIIVIRKRSFSRSDMKWQTGVGIA